MTAFRPTLIIRESGFPESGKFLPVKSGILGIGIWNATNDWNPESKFHWQRQESRTWNSANHASLCKGADNMIIRLCKAWRVIRRSFFPFVREARRSFPKKRMPDRSCQYVTYFAKRASCRYGTILGDPGAVRRVDKMFVVKVYCKIETSSSRSYNKLSPRTFCRPA